MARINVEDDLDSKPQYKKLTKLLGGDDDRAMGMLIRFWRIAQRFYGEGTEGEGQLVPFEEIRQWELEPIVESGWAIASIAGVEALDASKLFGWYRQKLEAGKKGGRPKKPAGTEEEPAETGTEPGGTGVEPGQTDPRFPETGSNPPSPAPAPVPAPSPAPVREKKEKTNSRILAADGPEVKACLEELRRTLEHFGKDADPLWDRDQVVRLIAMYGFEQTLSALRGAKFEPAVTGKDGKSFNPKDHFTVLRLVNKAEIFKKCAGLGSENRETPQTQKNELDEIDADLASHMEDLRDE